MEPEKKDFYDFECVDCQQGFDIDDVIVKDDVLYCPNCNSTDILDLTDEG